MEEFLGGIIGHFLSGDVGVYSFLIVLTVGGIYVFNKLISFLESNTRANHKLAEKLEDIGHTCHKVQEKMQQDYLEHIDKMAKDFRNMIEEQKREQLEDKRLLLDVLTKQSKVS